MTRLPRRRLGTIWVCVLSAALTLTACASEPPAAAPSPRETPSPTPLTPVEALLATSADPAACAVSFAGDGIADAPVLETGGTLYAALPIPQREGAVFAGWYATPDDAAALAIPGRVNGSELVTCTGRERTLHAGWVTPERNAAEGARIPILMYHQFTAKPEGESGWLRGNYAYVGDWDAHLGYIAAQGFYLPTWLELDAFIDGRLFLPDHSVIVTDDDGDPTWLELAVPLVAKHAVMTTSFVITDGGPGPDLTPYVLKRSHTGHLHTAGANGKGQMVNLSPAEIAADLEASAATLGGVKEVVAYPFGHYDERTKQGTAQAGFSLGRTIEQGYVAIGQDKLALPSVRVNYGMDVDDLRKLIG